MRVAFLGVLLLVAVVCRGELLTFREQDSDSPGVRSETLVLVDDREADDPRFVGVMQQYDLSDTVDSTGESFTVWPTSSALMDAGWQSWVDQQLTIFDSLQGLLIPRCPHASVQPQADYPSLLSYMASSRFGPSMLTAYARQVDQDSAPGAFSVSLYGDNGVQESPEDEAEALEPVWDNSWQPASQAEPRFLDDVSWFGPQEDAELSMLGTSIGADLGRDAADPLFRSTSMDEQLAATWDPSTLRRDPEAEVDIDWGETCNFGLFIMLCVGCVAVWVGLVRAWVSCCRLEQQVKAAKKASAQHFTPNPLLAPLIPEGATSSMRNPGDVEVASEHPMEGTYYAPQGSEYVSIAYVPLQSEAHARA